MADRRPSRPRRAPTRLGDSRSLPGAESLRPDRRPPVVAPPWQPVPPVRPPRGRPPVTEAGATVSLDDDELTVLLRRVLTSPHKRVVWTGPGIDLLVRLDQTRAASVDAGVVVGFEVDGGDGPTTAVVTIAVGSKEAPAGLVAAADRPVLPASLAAWSDAVAAAAWRGLLEVATTAVAPLVPVALVAARGRLDVVPRDRYRWER